MTQETENAVYQWIQCLKKEELDQACDELELATQGSDFKKASRLHEWLLGNYTATDFVQSTESDDEELKTRREQLRKSFIDRTLYERSGSTIYDPDVDNDLPHPLSLVQSDETVQQRMIKLTGHRTSIGEANRLDLALNRDDHSLDRDIGTSEDESNEILPQVQLIHKLLTEYSSTMRTMEESNAGVRSTIKELQNEIAILKRSLNANVTHSNTPYTSQPVTSTRLDNAARTSPTAAEDISSVHQENRVNFQDTFSCHRYNSSSPIQTDRSTREIQLERQLRAQQQEIEELKRIIQSSEVIRESSINHTQAHGRQSRYDIGNIVRRWNVSYSGTDGKSIEDFLTRVSECQRLAGLSDREVLDSLSELLTGPAIIWYRNNLTK